jgi:hypothetical protein
MEFRKPTWRNGIAYCGYCDPSNPREVYCKGICVNHYQQAWRSTPEAKRKRRERYARSREAKRLRLIHYAADNAIAKKPASKSSSSSSSSSSTAKPATSAAQAQVQPPSQQAQPAHPQATSTTAMQTRASLPCISTTPQAASLPVSRTMSASPPSRAFHDTEHATSSSFSSGSFDSEDEADYQRYHAETGTYDASGLASTGMPLA